LWTKTIEMELDSASEKTQFTREYTSDSVQHTDQAHPGITCSYMPNFEFWNWRSGEAPGLPASVNRIMGGIPIPTNTWKRT